jgi:hypothetical protein
VRSRAKAVLAVALGLCGAILLIAGKTTAGAALECGLLILVLPAAWLGPLECHSRWVRYVLVSAVCLLAIRSVSTTDVPSELAVTDYTFVNQVWSILHRFSERVFG